MDQSSGEMTSYGRSPYGLASLDVDSKVELLSDIDESSEEYSSLGLDKLSFELIQINEVHSLVASLTLDIPYLQETNES